MNKAEKDSLIWNIRQLLHLEKDIEIISDESVIHLKVMGKRFCLYIKSLTYAGNPYPQNTTRAQLPRREEFETIKKDDSIFLFLGYDESNKVFACWDPVRTKERLNEKQYVSFFSRLNLQQSVTRGNILSATLLNDFKYVLFKLNDLANFLLHITEYFPNIQFEHATIAVSKNSNGILSRIEDDSSVKLLIDELFNSNEDVSDLTLMSSCMNEFGEFYYKMTLKDWHRIVIEYRANRESNIFVDEEEIDTRSYFAAEPIEESYDDVEYNNIDEDGIEHVYVDIPSADSHTDMEYEDEEIKKPDVPIDPEKLDKIFDNKATSYKYFWFISIISLAKERESIVIPYKDIVIRMAAIAWPIVFEYRIDLGKSDMLSKYLEQIKQETLLKKATSSKNVETYLSRHYDSYKIRSILEPLLINVPYRFLSPWIPYTTDKEVIEKSNSGYNACLYALRDDTIILNKMWWEYIKKNYTKIRNFSERSFIVYIKSRNSHSNLAKFMSKGWNLNICDEVEDIVVSPSQLKVNDNLISGDSKDNKEETNNRKQKRDKLRIIKHPLYAVRKQALLRAMGFFRVPAKIKDVARMISRTAWGAPINEDDVEDIIHTISDVEYSDGKYKLRKRQ